MPLTQEEETRVPARKATLIGRITLNLNVHCGCGFITSDVDAGVAHARTVGHTLHITGEIRNQR